MMAWVIQKIIVEVTLGMNSYNWIISYITETEHEFHVQFMFGCYSAIVHCIVIQMQDNE